MILSNAALNWASLRSGLPLPDFISTLTPEREEEILSSYNAWRRSKGLPEDKPLAPPQKPAAAAAKPEAAEDGIERLMVQIAGEVEEEAEEEAALIEETMEQIDSMPVEEVPEEIAREVREDEPEEGAPGVDDVREAGPDVSAPTEDAAASPDAPLSGEAVAPSIADDIPATGAVSDRFAAIARKLPRESDPALYAQIYDTLGGSVEALRMAAQITWEEFRRKHRGTAAISAFLNWLNTKA